MQKKNGLNRHYCLGMACLAMGLAGQVSMGAVDYGVNNPASLTTAGYTQNFDSLPAVTGTSASLNGWYTVSETDGNAGPRLDGWDIYTGATPSSQGGVTGHDRLYGAGGTSVSSTGAFLDLGDSTTAGSNRALGELSASTVGAMYMSVTLVNNTGSPITSLAVSYTGEIWRSGGTFVSGANNNSLTFQYLESPTGLIGVEYYPNSVASLKFNSPSTNNTGTAATYDGDKTTAVYPPVTLTGTIDLSASPLMPGQSIGLKWVGPGQASSTNADALAIDNVSVVPTLAVPEPASLGLLAVGGMALVRRRRA
ncbi:MAG TPA: PEP-CTERM sorting domain-containing protein [Tepidisphaeraceae bacterium]|jgi:hypothetical protein|nr:PEP-CTERM sorting domain-containing protein [Tepidisphaeraceae bacterium]